jgi:hypothetical protein
LQQQRTNSKPKFAESSIPRTLPGVLASLRDARQHYFEWEKQATEALCEAYNLNHPILIFQALTISAKIRIYRLFDERFNAINDGAPYVVERSRKAALERLLDEAARLNAVNGSEIGRAR